jgi:purine-binding chemotaxis protein CheW
MTTANRGSREEFLSFKLGGEEYAIDILTVREIRAYAPVTRIANTPAYIKGVFNLRGAIVPVLDLRIKMGFPKAEYDSFTVVIIIDVFGRSMGVVVDAVSDVVGLQSDEIRPAPPMPGGLEAAMIRGLAPIEGRMLIVLDIASLMESCGMAPLAEAA